MVHNSYDDEGTPIDRVIRKAMDDGKFDGLAWHGQPFPREEENPWEDPADWAAHRLLKAAGFSLPWIEEKREIEEQIIMARASLIRSYRYWRDVPPEYFGDGRWQGAIQTVRERCADINRLIR